MEYNNIVQIKNFRLFAHSYIYNNTNITDLIDHLEAFMCVKSAGFDDISKTIELIVPRDSYRTQIFQYFDMINNAFDYYFNDNCTKMIIDQAVSSLRDRSIYETYIDIKTEKIPVCALYDATLIPLPDGDDKIIIRL